MSRRCPPQVRPRAHLISRLACDFADGAVKGPSGLVVMILDDDGMLAAVRQADDCDSFAPADIEVACATLLDLSPPAGPAAAAIVSINLGFDAHMSASAWHGMRRRFEQDCTTLVDWLLVNGETTTSMATASGQPLSW